LGADRWIETLPRRGYLFVGSVVASNEAVLSTPATGGRAAPLLHSDRPSIAVLPFQNMSEAPDQHYFADGMDEEIITALSRIRRLLEPQDNLACRHRARRATGLRRGRRWPRLVDRVTHDDLCPS
jgi:adenylate cyclase